MILAAWSEFWLLLGCFAVAGIVYYKYKRRHLELLGNKFPGPKGLPIVGNGLIFLGCTEISDMFVRLMGLIETWGTMFRVWLGPQLWIFIADPKCVEAVLTNPQALEKASIYQFFTIMTDGIFIATMPKWYKLRKFINSTMNQKLLEGYIDEFNKQAAVLIRVLFQHKGKFIDPHHNIGRCLLDITFKTHWGLETNEQESCTSTLSEDVSKSTEYFFHRTLKPWLHPLFMYKMTSYYKFVDERRNILFKILRQRAKERIERKAMEDSLPDGDVNKRKNVYLDMVVDWAKSIGREDLEFVQLNAADVLIAGSDTTSGTFCQMLYEVASHPEIEKRLYEETQQIFSDDMSRDVNKADLLKMTYLDMVINETFRLYAPPGIARQIHQDIHTERGVIPAGSSVDIMIYKLHRDPKYWEKHDQFYPEHFLPEAVASRPKYTFLPFSYGPRNCPGKYYTYWLFKVCMSWILRKYRLETDMPPKGVKLKFVFVLEPVDGFSIKFIPREETND